MIEKNLLALIKVHKPRSALFTTYTLSLSFFEAVFLPVLRKAGCRDVSILVDADEARQSAFEAQAEFAGRRYWVAPVAAPGGGVFHPKLAYLAGDRDDLLVVGSGNMTLPGQSSQLETVDAVTSSSSPEVFGDFADMFEALHDAVRVDSEIAARLMLDCARRARAVSAGASTSADGRPKARLIHTVGGIAADHIVQLWGQQDQPCDRLTILSPFHAPDAGPLVRLRRRLDASALDIGLGPKDRVAPFDQHRLPKGWGARYVEPSVDVPRRLHAKVIELQGAHQTLLITGSINATSQSLETEKNVEASLARWLATSPFEWNEVSPTEFAPNRFVPAAAASDVFYLDAAVDAGVIHGRVHRTVGVSTSARALLTCDGVTVTDVDEPVDIAADGAFSFVLRGGISRDTSVQLTLQCQDFSARGWLNVIDDLVATDEERRERQAMAHILRGDFDTQDVAQLLGLLSRVVAEGKVGPQGEVTPGKTGKSQTPNPDDGVSVEFTYQQWQQSAGGFRSRNDDITRNALALKAFLRWLNIDVPEPRSATESDPSASQMKRSGFRALDDGSGGANATEAGGDIQSQLLALIQAIPAVLQRSTSLEHGATLAMVAGAHALKLALTSRFPVTEAISPTLRWLSDFSNFSYGEPGRTELVQCAGGIAVTTGALLRRANVAMPSELLKDTLLAFAALAPDSLNPLSRSAEELLGGEVFLRVNSDLRALAVEVLDEIRAAGSLDERVLALVESAWAGEPNGSLVHDASFPGVFAALRSQRRAKLKWPMRVVIESERALSGCPTCSRQFPESTLRELKQRHVAVCPS